MAAKKGDRRAQVQAALGSWFDARPSEKETKPEAPKKKALPKKGSKRRTSSKSKSEKVQKAEATPKLSVVPPEEPSPAKPKKVQATFQLLPDLLEEARDTVVALAGPPESLTLAELVARGIRRELDALREQYNDGERFPSRKSPLRQGRPIGS